MASRIEVAMDLEQMTYDQLNGPQMLSITCSYYSGGKVEHGHLLIQ
jgi:hypothetical protein